MRLWWLIGASVLLTAAIKATGPVLVGGREPPAWLLRVVALAAAALLSALVVTSTLTDGRNWAVGANTVGVAAAAVVLWRRGPLILAAVVAVAVTAGLRAAGAAA